MAKKAPIPVSEYMREEKARIKKMNKSRRPREHARLRQDVVRGMCGGNFRTQKVTAEVEGRRKARQMASLYLDKVDRYVGGYRPSYKRKSSLRASDLGCFARAVCNAQEAGLTPEEFLESQFFYLHSWYSRCPRPSELASHKAIKRAEEWKACRDKGEAPKATVSAVQERLQQFQTTLQDEERVFQRMCRLWGGESEVWQMFGDPEDESVFSNTFKETKELWLKMYR